MNFGFINFYPYRPHGHHAEFLRQIIDSEGHNTYSLDCKSSIPNCYLREVKGAGRSECIKCSLGALSSFDFDRTESIRKYNDGEKWIHANKIDAVFLFNGRMDITRAAFEACKQLSVPCITHERPLFGHGLILNLNENCSSLKNIHRINKEFSDKPLTSSQLLIASKLLAQRFRGENSLEWKRYNESPSDVTQWPIKSNRKILICPSSKNELLGHPDWKTPWSDNTDALDLLFDQEKISPADCVVRFHPSWAVSFGRSDAKKCIEHYMEWCNKHGIYFYESGSSVNTRDLIRLSDLVVLNGSNTILEAGALGKPTLCLGPSPYTYSGCAEDVLSFEQLQSLDLNSILDVSSASIIRKTLRYAYSKAAREPLYLNNVRSNSVTDCEFYEGAGFEVIDSVMNGRFVVDDEAFSDSQSDEDEFIDKFLNWDSRFLEAAASWDWTPSGNPDMLKVKRSGALHLIDKVRNLFPKGI